MEMNKAFWANADADIRECYFSSTVSADDDWTNKFFGGLGDKMNMKTKREDKQGGGGDASEEDKGKYMPLGGGGAAASTGGDVDDSFDSSDDVDEDEIMNRISAEYGLAAAGKSSQQDFEQDWKQAGSSTTLAKDKWQSMFGRKKETMISTSDFYDNGDEDTKRPLTDDTTCKELL
jgi:hypothetical protein